MQTSNTIPLPRPGTPNGCYVNPQFILIRSTAAHWVIEPMHRQGPQVRLPRGDASISDVPSGVSVRLEGRHPRTISFYPHRFFMTAGRLRRLVDEFARAEFIAGAKATGMDPQTADTIASGTAQLSRHAAVILANTRNQ